MGRKLTYAIIAAVMLLSLPVSAQHYIGVKGGYGGMSGRFYPKYETSTVWNKYTGGVIWKYYSPQQVVGGVSAELEYQMRGYRLYEGSIVSDTTSYISKTRTVNSITMPLIWQPHLYLAKRHLRVFLNAGVTLSYNLGIGDTFTVFDHKVDNAGNVTTSTVTTDYTMNRARDNRWNYGLCFGGGFGVLFGRWEVFAEARYYYGMSDILRNKTKYTFNEQGTIRSELDNVFFNFGFFIRLGKGGILEPPLKRNKGKQSDTNDFRNIKLRF